MLQTFGVHLAMTELPRGILSAEDLLMCHTRQREQVQVGGQWPSSGQRRDQQVGRENHEQEGKLSPRCSARATWQSLSEGREQSPKVMNLVLTTAWCWRGGHVGILSRTALLAGA